MQTYKRGYSSLTDYTLKSESKYFNHVAFKGIKEDKNIYAIDQDSFHDAKNMWVNNDMQLVSRDPLIGDEIYDEWNGVGRLKDITKINSRFSVVVYENVGQYNIYIIDNNRMLKPGVSGGKYQISVVENYVICFLDSGAKYFDTNADKIEWKALEDILDVPVTAITTGSQTSEFEKNNFTDSYKTQYIVSNSSEPELPEGSANVELTLQNEKLSKELVKVDELTRYRLTRKLNEDVSSNPTLSVRGVVLNGQTITVIALAYLGYFELSFDSGMTFKTVRYPKHGKIIQSSDGKINAGLTNDGLYFVFYDDSSSYTYNIGTDTWNIKTIDIYKTQYSFTTWTTCDNAYNYNSKDLGIFYAKTEIDLGLGKLSFPAIFLDTPSGFCNMFGNGSNDMLSNKNVLINRDRLRMSLLDSNIPTDGVIAAAVINTVYTDDMMIILPVSKVKYIESNTDTEYTRTYVFPYHYKKDDAYTNIADDLFDIYGSNIDNFVALAKFIDTKYEYITVNNSHENLSVTISYGEGKTADSLEKAKEILNEYIKYISFTISGFIPDDTCTVGSMTVDSVSYINDGTDLHVSFRGTYLSSTDNKYKDFVYDYSYTGIHDDGPEDTKYYADSVKGKCQVTEPYDDLIGYNGLNNTQSYIMSDCTLLADKKSAKLYGALTKSKEFDLLSDSIVTVAISGTIYDTWVVNDTYYILTSDGLYTNYMTDNEFATVTYTHSSSGTFTKVPDVSLSDNQLYLAFGNDLWITSNSYDENDNLRLAAYNRDVQSFISDITGMINISTTEVALFFNDKIKICSKVEDENFGFRYDYYNTKLSLGTRRGDSIINTLEGSYTLFPTIRGLASMNYQEFMATTDQVVRYITDDISDMWTKFYQDSEEIHIIQHRSHLFITNGTTDILLYDFRINAWWFWQVPVNINRLFTDQEELTVISSDAEEPLVFKRDTTLYYGDLLVSPASIVNMFRNDKTKFIDIEWFLVSQPLHFNAPSYYKNIKQLIFQLDEDVRTNETIDAQIKLYRKKVTVREPEIIEFKVDELRTFVKRFNYWKINELQWALSNDQDTVTPAQIKLNTVTVKYEIGDEVR